MLKKSKQNGFTLLELTIVLTIVTLIIYGTLKGVAMLDNAESKRLLEDIQSFRSSYYAFQDRVGHKPGEVAPLTIGNAKAVDVSNNDFFGELFAQGFITSANPIPTGNIAGSFEVYNVASQALADSDNAVHIGSNQLCVTRVEGMLAQGIDYKLDDGKADSGNLQAETGIATPEDAYESGTLVTICLEL